MPPATSVPAIATPDRSITRDALTQRARQAATGFASFGLKRGDVVALLMRNDIPFFEATLGANMCGAYSVPVNWHLAGPEISYVLNDSGASCLVVHADLLDGLAPHLPDGIRVLVVETPPAIRAAFDLADAKCAVPDGATDWETWVESHAPRTEAPEPPRGAIIYTSGTTGHPKGVMRDAPTPEIARAQLLMSQEVYGIFPDTRTAIVTPVYHAAPSAFSRFSAENAEFMLLLPRFDAEELLATIEKYRINTLCLVPAIFVKLLKLPKEVRDKYDVSSLRRVSHTASPCPPEVKRALIEWWGPVVYEFYGGTESGVAVVCSSEDWLENPGTVGRPTTGTTLRILDDDGNDLPRNEIGEIFIRNVAYPPVTYLGNPEAFDASCNDGFVSLGDVGYVDDNGYLYVCDRKKDMVIFGGTNVYPAEIEAVMLEMTQIEDCAVIGVDDPDFGERLQAHVLLRPGAALDADEIVTFLTPRLARYKIPRDIRFVDALPREASGKIMKRKLKQARQ